MRAMKVDLRSPNMLGSCGKSRNSGLRSRRCCCGDLNKQVFIHRLREGRRCLQQTPHQQRRDGSTNFILAC